MRGRARRGSDKLVAEFLAVRLLERLSHLSACTSIEFSCNVLGAVLGKQAFGVLAK